MTPETEREVLCLLRKIYDSVCKDKLEAKPRTVIKGVSTQTDEQWLTALCSDPAYKHITDVRREHAKAKVWCQTNQRVMTRRFFVNWLNKIDRPMQAQAAPPPAPPVYSRSTPSLPPGVPCPEDALAKLSALRGKDMSF